MFEKKYILALDQGTTSTRAIIFNHNGEIVSKSQFEHKQIFPRPGWVEHDPLEIWENTKKVIGIALLEADINRHSLAGVGITNQRETTVIWNKNTGIPIYNAIVWQDTRTQQICDKMALVAKKNFSLKHENEILKNTVINENNFYEKNINRFKDICGLPLATYFSAPKIKWILDNIPNAKKQAEKGELYFGTMDSWLLWNLTGGTSGGVHFTDVTNASRTMLMNIRTLQWDENICKEFDIPISMLPEIKSSSEIYGYGRKNGLLIDTPIAAILGDQQAATFGQACFTKGQMKNTYGTGCFILLNTGEEVVTSKKGLLTTVLYKLADSKPVYALEGSIAVTGSLVQWLRDNLGIINKASEVEILAKQVPDTGDVYFVPAFSGLFAPHWRPDARGIIAGLTRFSNKLHIARAALESTALQTYEVIQAMYKDSGVKLKQLKVDGAMTSNNLLMQFQADILDVEVICPKVSETTALGAAYAAGLATGFWASTEQVSQNWQMGKSWNPSMSEEDRSEKISSWKKAISKSLSWT